MSPSIKDDPGNKYTGNDNSGNSLKIIIIVVGAIIIVLLAIIVGMMLGGRGDKSAEDEETEKVIETTRVITEETSIAPAPAAPSKRGVWSNGQNVLNGTFYYEGAPYPFRVLINYDVNSGRVTSASYAATNQNFSKIKNGTVTVSGDGTEIYINGTSGGYYTNITMTANPGSRRFEGYMYRGTHEGSVVMTLQ